MASSNHAASSQPVRARSSDRNENDKQSIDAAVSMARKFMPASSLPLADHFISR